MNHGFIIKTIRETASTSLLMQEWAKVGKLKYGDVLRANNQPGGIGQRGNSWESESGKNLTFSLCLETRFLPSEHVFQLNKAISLSVYDYLVAKNIIDVKIKWPNDVYVGDKKIAGMITHNSFLGNKLERSIVGIGLNMNQEKFESDAPNPVSLKQISGIVYELDLEFNLLLHFIEKRFNQLKEGDRLQLNADYLQHLFGLGEKRPYKDSEGSFIGIIKGVDSFGRLMVEKEKGLLFTYDMKEIEFL